MAKAPLQLALAPARSGRMGSLDLGREYMATVKDRAKRLHQASAVRAKRRKP